MSNLKTVFKITSLIYFILLLLLTVSLNCIIFYSWGKTHHNFLRSHLKLVKEVGINEHTYFHITLENDWISEVYCLE